MIYHHLYFSVFCPWKDSNGVPPGFSPPHGHINDNNLNFNKLSDQVLKHNHFTPLLV